MDRVDFKLLGTWKSSETGFSLYHHKDFECFVEQTGMWQAFLSCLNPRYQKYVKCLALSSILLLLTVYSEIIRWKCLKQSSALGVPLCLWVERTNFLTFIIFKKQQLMTALELGNFFQVDRIAINSPLHQTNMLKLPRGAHIPLSCDMCQCAGHCLWLLVVSQRCSLLC